MKSTFGKGCCTRSYDFQGGGGEGKKGLFHGGR